MPYTIEELRRIITPIAQAHGLRSVSLFGSYSKGTACRDSDVDLKIEKAASCPCSSSAVCGWISKMP